MVTYDEIFGSIVTKCSLDLRGKHCYILYTFNTNIIAVRYLK